MVPETLAGIHEAAEESGKRRTAACARVLEAVEEERTAATESCVRVRAVAEEERTAATWIRACAHGAAASRGAVGGGGDLRSRP